MPIEVRHLADEGPRYLISISAISVDARIPLQIWSLELAALLVALGRLTDARYSIAWHGVSRVHDSRNVPGIMNV